MFISKVLTPSLLSVLFCFMCNQKIYAVDVIEALIGLLLETDVVENEELRLGPKERRVGDARALQIIHRLAGDVTRVARVRLAGYRIANDAPARFHRPDPAEDRPRHGCV